MRTFDIVLDDQFVQGASLIEIALVLIHEAIHAEIMERCIKLGIISNITYNSQWEALVNFNNNITVSSNFSDILFASLIDRYSSYNGPPVNTNWQHEIFDVAGYRTQITQDLEAIHNFLDNPRLPFVNNLNNGTVIALTMEEFFNLLSWYSLEGTDSYSNLTPLELTKKTTAINQMEQYYNKNCN